MLKKNGYDSVYAIANVSGVNYDEFVVYEPERVVKWMICYPSKDKFGRPTETKPERPDPTCEVDMDFVEQQLFYTYRHSGRTRLLYNKLT